MSGAQSAGPLPEELETSTADPLLLANAHVMLPAGPSVGAPAGAAGASGSPGGVALVGPGATGHVGARLRDGNRVSLPPLRQHLPPRAVETQKVVRLRQLEKLRKLQND